MLNHLFPFLKKPPGLVMIVAALALAGLGHLVHTYGVLKPLTNFTSYTRSSLETFDALNLGRTFYSELSGCELQGGRMHCVPGPSDSDVLMDAQEGRTQPGWFMRLWTAIGDTIDKVGAEATWYGGVIYLTSLAASGVWLARLGRGELLKSGVFGWAVLILLTPAVASLLALGLKWLLLLLSFAFSAVLGGVVWLIVTFGALIKFMTFGVGVLNSAHKLETMAGATALQPPPVDGPKA